MDRRQFNKGLLLLGGSLVLQSANVWSKKYMTFNQAKIIIWQNLKMSPFEIEMTKNQIKQIKSTSKQRVHSKILKGLKSEDNNWLILDQVIGKHEFIDLAVGISNKGEIMGIEILTYRESYGDEVMNSKWRDQFHGTNAEDFLQLDKQIRNISGATMSCSHITNGINRLTQTWKHVLQFV